MFSAIILKLEYIKTDFVFDFIKIAKYYTSESAVLYWNINNTIINPVVKIGTNRGNENDWQF